MDKEARETLKGLLTYGIGVAVLVGIVFLLCGCMAPVTVNVGSSRLVVAYGTNVVSQRIDGGATTTPGVNGDKAIKEAASVARRVP